MRCDNAGELRYSVYRTPCEVVYDFGRAQKWTAAYAIVAVIRGDGSEVEGGPVVEVAVVDTYTRKYHHSSIPCFTPGQGEQKDWDSNKKIDKTHIHSVLRSPPSTPSRTTLPLPPSAATTSRT